MYDVIQVSGMRRLNVLLAFAVSVTGAATFLNGCESSAPMEEPIAPASTAAPIQDVTANALDAPASTAAPIQDATATALDAPASTAAPIQDVTATALDAPTSTAASLTEATATTSNVADSPTMPTPAPEEDDGLEFAPLESLETSGKDEGITTADQDPPKGDGESEGSVQGQTYTWEDGGRTLMAYLQTDIVVEKGSDGLPRDIVAADEGGTNIVRSADRQSKGDTLPVFRSESGELMTLPGGVLLVLSAQWSRSETNAFFSSNGIKMDRVSELGYIANGFFI